MEQNGAEIRNNLGTAVIPATTSFGGGSSAVVGEPLAAAVATTIAPPAQPVSANLQFAQPSGKPLVCILIYSEDIF